MLLTISTTHQPATDLGYLLHKNPASLQSFSLNFGQAHVFYTETSIERCTAALLLDINTVDLVRSKDSSISMDQYVNDRPYVASSFLSVALADVFGAALNGRCKQRPELVTSAIPLEAKITVIPSRKGEEWLRKLFEPLGYQVETLQHGLDAEHPEWGDSPYFTLTLRATCRLSELLTHLYVLIPVLDNAKHYWIGNDEVEKLLKRGSGWLQGHPERRQIAYNYLRHKHNLTRDALERLLTEDVQQEEDTASATEAEEADVTTSGSIIDVEPAVESVPAVEEKRTSLHEQRLDAALEVLKQSGARRVLDLGCGEGRLLKKLLQEKNFEHILGLDVSYHALELAQKRLHMERMAPRQRARITLLHGALTYRDKRLAGYDAAAVIEVIEHLDPARLSAFERVLFEFAHPATVIITTPNAEYNVKYETLDAGTFRHQDHRFEWTRTQFQDWAAQVAERSGYQVRFAPIGTEDTEVGAPSQMGVFSLRAANAEDEI
ncbi:3' terminal RNA ribose 2'-O-methyltransferase Hen1 [Dictyobacter alpinus]|uniref:Small RNA 2'-O-methyltransferase n=1 Tax=Dictyobacter alpinus TaxID=2014873 RepID=A0A402BA34_9CHLR|nr:3' terminal RNA ribose 2'-O-methyltransferase Hen1 [Dictyobacter alpinus]GCE28238.1 3' terminal RNA ribose 2'-O-methyltransferase Hen1 [Dictyobacter alpinus]